MFGKVREMFGKVREMFGLCNHDYPQEWSQPEKAHGYLNVLIQRKRCSKCNQLKLKKVIY